MTTLRQKRLDGLDSMIWAVICEAEQLDLHYIATELDYVADLVQDEIDHEEQLNG